MNAIFTVGVSASGKSTWAKEYCRVTGAYEINRDDIRTLILMNEGSIDHPSQLWTKWNFKRESEVDAFIESSLKFCIANKLDVVFSNTNLNVGRLNKSIKEMEDLGFIVLFKYFPIDEISVAIKRDRKRSPNVGESVIKSQWKQWLALGESVTGIKQYVADKTKPKAIVIDIDGTVAKMVNRGPFEWHKVDTDVPIDHTISFIQSYEFDNYDTQIIFLSGRDSVCREKTVAWIDKHIGIFDYQLYMREANDNRRDRIIKSELFWEHIADKYNVVAAFDDRKQMVHFWTDIGVPLFNVGNVYDDF
jgi:predicted kinase